MFITLTKEEEQHIYKIKSEYNKTYAEIKEIMDAQETEENRTEYLMQAQSFYEAMVEELESYLDTCQRARFKDIAKGGDRSVLDHAKEQAPIILERLYQDAVKNYSYFDTDVLQGLNVGIKKDNEIYLSEVYAKNTLKSELRLHIEYFKDDKEKMQALMETMLEAVKDFKYIDLTDNTSFDITRSSAIDENFMPMYVTRELKKLDYLTASDFVVVPENDISYYIENSNNGDYHVIIDEFSKISATMSIKTNKLLKTAIAELTRTNRSTKKNFNLEVRIPFDEYALANKYDIVEHPKETEEEAKKEHTRVTTLKRQTRKRLKEQLELLQHTTIKFEGTNGNYLTVMLFQEHGIDQGYIYIKFTERLVQSILKNKLITYYPKKMLAIPSTNPNAYYMGCKMSEHFYMDNNFYGGTNNRLKVSTLLKVTKLPDYESLRTEGRNKDQDNRRQWETRIKEPFMDALDCLMQNEVINDWKFVHTKGKELTDKEAYSINDYYTFADLYVQYEMTNPDQNLERLTNKKDRVVRASELKKAKEDNLIRKSSKNKK